MRILGTIDNGQTQHSFKIQWSFKGKDLSVQARPARYVLCLVLSYVCVCVWWCYAAQRFRRLSEEVPGTTYARVVIFFNILAFKIVFPINVLHLLLLGFR